MRVIVVMLAVLAIAKVYVEQRIYRDATSQALIDAYRPQAIAACARSRNTAAGRGPVDGGWPGTIDAAVAIGRPDLGVLIWDLNHPLWSAAHARAYLMLTHNVAGVSADTKRAGWSGTRSGQPHSRCIYDFKSGSATLSQRQ